MNVRYLCILLSVLVSLPSSVKAQEIEFGSYENYPITTEVLPGYGSLDFGSIITSEGNVSVNFGDDPGMAVVAVEGVGYLDVIVTITKPDALLPLDAGIEDEIPFTSLEAAYANHGNEDYTQAKFFNALQARFPILARQGPVPGPPPTPPIEGVAPPLETAYIYLWGTINVGNVAAGSYSSFIDITVEYN